MMYIINTVYNSADALYYKFISIICLPYLNVVKNIQLRKHG